MEFANRPYLLRCLISLSACICLVGIFGACDASPKKENTLSVDHIDTRSAVFDNLVEELFQSRDEYEAIQRWNDLYKKIDFSDLNQIPNWLNLQKTILSRPIDQEPYLGSAVYRSAIQEFRLLSEYASPYKDWLRDCKKNNYFVDPFINQNLDIILERLENSNNPADNSTQKIK